MGEAFKLAKSVTASVYTVCTQEVQEIVYFFYKNVETLVTLSL